MVLNFNHKVLILNMKNKIQNKLKKLILQIIKNKKFVKIYLNYQRNNYEVYGKLYLQIQKLIKKEKLKLDVI